MNIVVVDDTGKGKDEDEVILMLKINHRARKVHGGMKV
jgi:hypothetical protein